VLIPLKDNCQSLRIFLSRLSPCLHIAFQVLIGDLGSTDCDVEETLRRSNVPGRVVHGSSPKGVFCRSMALNLAASAVPEDGVALVIDASMELPCSFLEAAPSRIIPGHKVWAPIAWDTQHPVHHWLSYGIGYVGFHRRDFDRVGGYDAARWGCRWGGEDTDLIKKFLKLGLLVHRDEVEGFVRHKHVRVRGYKQNNNDYPEEDLFCHTPFMRSLPRWCCRMWQAQLRCSSRHIREQSQGHSH